MKRDATNRVADVDSARRCVFSLGRKSSRDRRRTITTKPHHPSLASSHPWHSPSASRRDGRASRQGRLLLLMTPMASYDIGHKGGFFFRSFPLVARQWFEAVFDRSPASRRRASPSSVAQPTAPPASPRRPSGAHDRDRDRAGMMTPWARRLLQCNVIGHVMQCIGTRHLSVSSSTSM